MDNVVIDMRMSLDGYIAAPNDNLEEGLGEDGMRLHNWMFDDPSVFERVYGNLVEETGAVIIGRRTYDNSIHEEGRQGSAGRCPVLRGHPQGDRWRGPGVHIRHRRDRQRAREGPGGRWWQAHQAHRRQPSSASRRASWTRSGSIWSTSCSVEDDPYSIGFRSRSS
jgi:hypothetical protein